MYAFAFYPLINFFRYVIYVRLYSVFYCMSKYYLIKISLTRSDARNTANIPYKKGRSNFNTLKFLARVIGCDVLYGIYGRYDRYIWQV